ncbi:hypothetical protein GCM10008941_07140 [Rhizomicrobium palustre]
MLFWGGVSPWPGLLREERAGSRTVLGRGLGGRVEFPLALKQRIGPRWVPMLRVIPAGRARASPP